MAGKDVIGQNLNQGQGKTACLLPNSGKIDTDNPAVRALVITQPVNCAESEELFRLARGKVSGAFCLQWLQHRKANQGPPNLVLILS